MKYKHPAVSSMESASETELPGSYDQTHRPEYIEPQRWSHSRLEYSDVRQAQVPLGETGPPQDYVPYRQHFLTVARIPSMLKHP